MIQQSHQDELSHLAGIIRHWNIHFVLLAEVEEIEIILIWETLILCCILSSMHACMLSHLGPVLLFVTLWAVAHQASLSMGFSRQEYLSGLPCPPPGDLPDPGIEPASLVSPALQADSLPLSHQGSPLSSISGVIRRKAISTK